MRNIYCTHGRHYVASALIHDLKVRQPMCLDCRARILAAPRIKPEPRPANRPARMFQVLVR